MTKVIEFSEIVRICEQKKQTGDIQTLSRMFLFIYLFVLDDEILKKCTFHFEFWYISFCGL
ncbi:hypothetical protein [Capnocytophaga canimorsus]|uniref:hypothetical protein n=1 Tax=Capnocytophaga canimorsus TaxID=28188 RepID=UPI001BB4324C|nr:hypothetical protein [Capnocytophaga canimorsus]